MNAFIFYLKQILYIDGIFVGLKFHGLTITNFIFVYYFLKNENHGI